jgi:hypothetical protein
VKFLRQNIWKVQNVQKLQKIIHLLILKMLANNQLLPDLKKKSIQTIQSLNKIGVF